MYYTVLYEIICSQPFLSLMKCGEKGLRTATGCFFQTPRCTRHQLPRPQLSASSWPFLVEKNGSENGVPSGKRLQFAIENGHS